MTDDDYDDYPPCRPEGLSLADWAKVLGFFALSAFLAYVAWHLK